MNFWVAFLVPLAFQAKTARYLSLHQLVVAVFFLAFLLQVYVYRKIGRFIQNTIQSEPGRQRWNRVLVGWSILINLPYLGFALYLAGLLSFENGTRTGRVITLALYPFFIWQFGAFFFFAAALTKDCLMSAAGLVGRFILKRRSSAELLASPAPLSLSRRNFVNGLSLTAAAVPFGVVSYGIVMAEESYELVRVRLPIRNLPRQFEGFRLVQLTDIHAGMFMSEARMAEFASVANGLAADLIVLTGDYVATSRESVAPFMRAFGGLRARHGVFGVLGNHDVFTESTELLIEQFRRRNFKLMINEQERIERNGARLNLLGIEFLPQSDVGLAEPLRDLNMEGPNILLSHQPNVLPEAAKRDIDLVLAGHLHGGQMKVELLGHSIAPSRLVSPYIAGRYWHNATQMYLSRGLGTTAVPIRINAQPELTEITLVRDTGGASL